MNSIQLNVPAADPSKFELSSWSDSVGNFRLKDECQGIIRKVRFEKRRKLHLLATGPSRAGKSSLLEFTAKGLLCCNLDPETLIPCGVCVNCSNKVYKTGTRGWNNHVDWQPGPENPTPVRFHYHVFDCARASTQSVEELLVDLEVDDGNLRIVYLDEVHRLSKQSLDERFLKPMDLFDVIWLASSAVATRTGSVSQAQTLDPMFLKRFTSPIATEKPSKRDLSRWIFERCKQFNLKFEDPNYGLPLIAERSNRIPGMALRFLCHADMARDGLITNAMINNYEFDVAD